MSKNHHIHQPSCAHTHQPSCAEKLLFTCLFTCLSSAALRFVPHITSALVGGKGTCLGALITGKGLCKGVQDHNTMLPLTAVPHGLCPKLSPHKITP